MNASRSDRPRPTPAARSAQILPDLLACALLLAAASAIAYPRYLLGIDLSDEGFLATGAMRVLDGELPHRDFVSLQPPLGYYSVAALFALAEPSLALLRGFGLALHLALACLVYALARQRASALPAWLGALPATLCGLPLFLFVPFAMWQGIALQLAAAIALLRFGATGRRVWALGAGIVIGVAAFTRHDQAVFGVLAALVYAAALRALPEHPDARPRRLLGLAAAGLAIPTLPFVLAMAASGALPEMFRQLVVFPWTTYTETSSIPMPWFETGQDADARWGVVGFYLPNLVQLAFAALLGTRLWRGHPRAGDAGRVFVLALSLVFHAQVWTRSDTRHLLITLPPLFALAGLLFDEALRGFARLGASIAPSGWPSSRVRGIAAATLCVAAFGIGAWAAPRLLPAMLPGVGRPASVLVIERAGVVLARPDARLLGRLVLAIRERSAQAEPILVLPYEPLLYFLADRRNPTRWNYLWPGDQSEEDYRELIAQARRAETPLVILRRPEAMRPWAAPLLDFVEREYVLEQRLGPFAFYLRRGLRAPGD